MRLRRRPPSSVVLSCAVLGLILLRLFSGSNVPDSQVFDEGTTQQVKRVVDGDTLLLEDGQRVRLIGIDTPETKRPDFPVEPLGPEASQFTTALVGDGQVRLEFDRERLDQYHRLLAYVYLPDGRLLNEEIIRAGFSQAQLQYPYRSDMKQRFREAEEEARSARRGLWADHDH